MTTTNDIYKIDEQGNRSYVCCYGGELSAEYALYLFWCQHLKHTDYMNLANRRKYTAKRVIGELTQSNVFIEHGTDTYICRATKEHGTVMVGLSSSKYDHEPVKLQ